MLRKTFYFFRTFLTHFLLAKRTRYDKLKDKIEIFRILNSLYIKSILNSGTNKEVSQMIFKYKVTGYSYSTILFLFKEIFVSSEYYFESKISNPAIIDCGANIGMSVIFFKFLYPGSSIIAFEPNPDAFNLLKKNVTQNNLNDVIVENIGLSNRKGFIDFFLSDFKGSFVGSIYADRGGEKAVSIQTEKLSDYISENTYDLIKIDIEGAETEVLADLKEADKLNNFKMYIIEYHHKMGLSKSALSCFIKPFENQDFEYNIKTSFRKLGKFQDIIIYFYKEEKHI